jgi:uncharacterized integral membrane protein (TIGR00698 family)
MSDLMDKYLPVKKAGFFGGLALVAGLSWVAKLLSETEKLQELRFSPLIVGILLGAVLGNTVRDKIPAEWNTGISYSSKIILRLAIILFGFRITFDQIAQVGLNGFIVDVIMLSTTLALGIFLGIRVFGLDKETAIMTAAGAAICGAAAVVATEPVVKAEPHKTAIAVATVVLFGTLAMFLYPLAYNMGWVPNMSPDTFGVYIGSTVHEVAHVAGAGAAAVAPEGLLAEGAPSIGDTAMIVKMTRVMLLAPALIVISWALARQSSANSNEKTPIAIPWFAVGFVAVSGFNSLDMVGTVAVENIVLVDTFLLTMAMTALGLDTNASKFKGVGMAPIYLATALFVWLIFGGYGITRLVMGAA